MSHHEPPSPVNSMGLVTQAAKSVARAPRTATADDLEVHRSYIEHLNIEEKATLPEIIDRMVRDHGLRPTYNMLRKRFRKWGIDNKKNNEREMRAMVRKTDERSRIGKASTFRARGRSIQYKDIVHYWERKRLSVEDVLANLTSRDSTPEGLEILTPVPSPVLPPAALEIPEQILTELSNYAHGSFESGTWYSVAEDCLCKSKKSLGSRRFFARDLTTLIADSLYLLVEARGRELEQRFSFFTRLIKEFIYQEKPEMLFHFMYLFRTVLRRGHAATGIAFTKAFALWGEDLLGRSHPFSRSLSLLALMDTLQLEDFTGRCLRKNQRLFRESAWSLALFNIGHVFLVCG